MKTYCLLSLDLPNVESPRRKDFYLTLSATGWEKITEVDTVWSRVFEVEMSLDTLLAKIRTNLGAVAKSSGVTHLTHVVQVGNNPPVSGYITKVDDGYSNVQLIPK